MLLAERSIKCLKISPTEFKERIKQYKGEEKFEFGKFVIMRRGNSRAPQEHM